MSSIANAHTNQSVIAPVKISQQMYSSEGVMSITDLLIWLDVLDFAHQLQHWQLLNKLL